MRRIDYIIVHCTATPAGREVTTDELRSWHKERGFSDIGYHYIIHLDGTVDEGRQEDRIGAHCKGHNQKTIGVVYVGGLDKFMKPADTRTSEQKESLKIILKHLKSRYPDAVICGHRDFAKVDCPCFNAMKEYENL